MFTAELTLVFPTYIAFKVMKMEVLFPDAAVVCDFLTKLSDIPKRGILKVLITFEIVPSGSKHCVYFSLFCCRRFFSLP